MKTVEERKIDIARLEEEIEWLKIRVMRLEARQQEDDLEMAKTVPQWTRHKVPSGRDKDLEETRR